MKQYGFIVFCEDVCQTRPKWRSDGDAVNLSVHHHIVKSEITERVASSINAFLGKGRSRKKIIE